jgi:hypothetical protein
MKIVERNRAFVANSFDVNGCIERHLSVEENKSSKQTSNKKKGQALNLPYY